MMHACEGEGEIEREEELLADVGQRVSNGCILIYGHLSRDCGALQ